MKNICWSVLLPAALVFSACSYSTESAVREILGASAEAPVFLGCKAVSEREITFQFSLPVKVQSLHFDPPAEIGSVDEGAVVTVNLSRPMEAGERVVVDILVEDQESNTLNVLVPFRARNDRMPALLITELRTEYSKPKVEFVELRTLSGGNLGALRLFIASNGIDEPLFEFPPAETAEGEYIVVHLRTIEPGWANETGADLGLSGGAEASKNVRDFWVPREKEPLRKTDVVFLMDQDDRILDAVLLSENLDSWGTKQELAAAAELADRQGAWHPANPGPADAAVSRYTTTTRTICRDETVPDSNRSGDWYITDTSNASPGEPNKSKRYVPK